VRKTRFIVAIGDAVLSALIRSWVTERPWLQLVGVCTTTDALLRCANRNTDAVLVTDARLGGSCIIPTLASMHLVNPGIRIVTVLEQPEGPQAAEVIRAGAMGIVAARDMAGFQEAIVKVLRGDLAMRGDLALRLMRAAYANRNLTAKGCGKDTGNRLNGTVKEVRVPVLSTGGRL